MLQHSLFVRVHPSRTTKVTQDLQGARFSSKANSRASQSSFLCQS